MSIVKSAAIISVSIFSSRVFGLIRDVVIAYLFGATAITDAFFVAFRIPNILRRIFAEGAFSSAFTPAFSKKLKIGKLKAKDFAEKFFSILIISLLLTVISGEILSPLIVKLIAPGLAQEYKETAVILTREMFPYIFFVSLVAFYGGILNSFDHFFAPAFSTTLFNISIIICALTLKPYISIHSLAVGVIIGGILQVLLQLIFMKKNSFFIYPKIGIDEDVKKSLKNIIPGIFGFGVRQISMLMDTVLASFLIAGSISYLYYANRFVQLPLGMFAIGLSQVLLPKLSKHYDNKEKYLENLTTGIALCFLIIIPSSIGLVFFGKPIVDLIFHHGKFTSEDINNTYWVLVAYSIGLSFFSLEKILTNALYSLDEYKFPVKVASLTLIFNFFADVIFCFILNIGTPGLALGTSLTSLITVIILLTKLNKFVPITLNSLKFLINYILLSLPILVISVIGSKIYFKEFGSIYHLTTIILTIAFSVTVYFITLILRQDKFLKAILRRQ